MDQSSLPKALICDIDKTLLFPEGFDFPAPKYYLNKCVWNIVNSVNSVGYRTVFLTCRPESMRQETHQELRKYFERFDLFMRPGTVILKDQTDDLIKKEIYLREIEPYYRVLYALDDKDIVKNMWKSLNIEVLNFYVQLD